MRFVTERIHRLFRHPGAPGPAVRLTLLATVVALAYGWTLGTYFAADDFGLVGRFVTFPWSSWPGLFFRDWSYGIWEPQVSELRPISALSFMIDGRLWGINAAGYHLTNVLMHFACAVLVMLVAAEVMDGHHGAALAASLIFALHPVTAGAVVWVSGRVDLLATAGLLLGFYAFLRYRGGGGWPFRLLAWVAFGFGLFAKESALLLPVLAMAHDLVSGRWRDRRHLVLAPYLGWAMVLAFYAYCRSYGMSAVAADAIASVGPGGMAMRLPQRVIPYALSMVVPPSLLLQVKPVVMEYVIPLAVTGLVVMAVIVRLAVAGWRRDAPAIRMGLFYGLIWPALATLPLVVTYLSFRHLYATVAGFVIGGVVLLARQVKPGAPFAAVVVLVIAVFGTQLAFEVTRYREALGQSRQIAEVVSRLAQVAAPGDVVVLDVPRRHLEMWVWAWASPFALRPPFVEHDLIAKLVVIERPSVYRRPDSWPRPGTAARLERASGSGWLISAAGGGATLRRLSDEELDSVQSGDILTGPDSFDDVLDRLARPE